MSWWLLALLSAFFNALFDFFTKLSSGKIHNGIGATILCFFAVIPTLIYTLITRSSGQKLNFSKEGLIFSILAGLMVGISTIFTLKMFNSGVNLSIGVPVFRISIIIIACLLGTILLKEVLTWRMVVGIFLSFVGIYLVVTAKTL